MRQAPPPEPHLPTSPQPGRPGLPHDFPCVAALRACASLGAVADHVDLHVAPGAMGTPTAEGDTRVAGVTLSDFVGAKTRSNLRWRAF